MKNLDITKKRKFQFIKIPKDVNEDTYAVISDSSIVLHATELCKMYDLELLALSSEFNVITIYINGKRSNFNLFVAGMCKEFAGRISSIEF